MIEREREREREREMERGICTRRESRTDARKQEVLDRKIFCQKIMEN